MREALATILGAPLNHAAWDQASLPVSLGGLGLRRAKLHAPGAYAISVAHTSSLVCKMLGTRPYVHNADQAITLLNDWSGEKYTFEVLKETSQKQVSHVIDLRCHHLLYNSTSDPREKARLGCVALPHSGDWLNALPSKALNLHMRPNEFRVAAKYRLGLPVFSSSATCPIQDCERENDLMGDHALGCPNNGERINRHNRLRDTVFKAAQSACLGPSQEIRGLLSGSEARPADVFIPAWDKGKDTALDITVVSPLQMSLVDKCAQNHHAALDHAHSRKLASAFQSCAQVNVSFIPLAVETLGAWHPEAIHHLTRIARSLARQSAAPESVTMKHFFQKLAVTLQRANATMILSRQTFFPEREVDGD